MILRVQVVPILGLRWHWVTRIRKCVFSLTILKPLVSLVLQEKVIWHPKFESPLGGLCQWLRSLNSLCQRLFFKSLTGIDEEAERKHKWIIHENIWASLWGLCYVGEDDWDYALMYGVGVRRSCWVNDIHAWF